MTRRLFAALCLLLAAAFAALGLWQVERRTWKRELIAKIEARTRAEPQALPPSDWKGEVAYTHVRTRGVFRHDQETLIQAATALGAGWWVVTPLRTGTGVVLVNRGFVPPERSDPAARRSGSPEGVVPVTGLLRTTEPGGGFLRRNDPASGRWYSRDVAAIARARGLGAVPPFFLDADATANSGGYPVGGLTAVAFRDNHLAYAITWFALAALSVGGFVLVLRSRKQGEA